jgi:hypothetical protein
MLLIVSAPPLEAQAGAVRVSATVVTDRLSAAAVRPLSLEGNRRAHSSTVLPTDTTAAQWMLVGQANTTVQTKFTLPAELVNLASAQARALPVAFSSQAGRWRQDVDDPNGATSFDPRVGTAVRFGDGATPTAYVWLGSTVAPTASAAPGAYEGTVTLTVYYY